MESVTHSTILSRIAESFRRRQDFRANRRNTHRFWVFAENPGFHLKKIVHAHAIACDTAAMNQLNLSLACSHYDHVVDLFTGAVTIPGVVLTGLPLSTQEIFFRTTRFQEFDISEMSLARYVAMRSAGNDSLVGLPVFPSRMFRHGAIFVKSDNRITEFSQLADARIGIAEWAQTAGVYVRAWLATEYGLDLKRIQWIQGGVDEAGREESIPGGIGRGYNIDQCSDRSLADLLFADEIDAIIAPHAPKLAQTSAGPIVPLMSEISAAEKGWFRRTGIYPAMHLIVIKKALHTEYPWLAAQVYAAFERALANSNRRLASTNTSTVAIAWVHDAIREAQAVMGRGAFDYGLEANRGCLEYFLEHAFEQALSDRRMQAEELFPVEVLHRHRV